MFRVLAAIVLAVSFLVLVLAGTIHHQLGQPVSRSALFDIPVGDNLSSITKRLRQDDLLPIDELLFKAVALVTRNRGMIQAGQYQIEDGMTAPELLALFRSGRVVQHRLTIPEGWTLAQWRRHLLQVPFLDVVTEPMSEAEIAQALNVSGPLEGWLFPDTYQYIKGDSDLDVMRMAVLRARSVLEAEWQTRNPAISLTTPYDAMILASIIEKETGNEADRQLVASVFHNRLESGMKLQSDPTVIYGLGEAFDGDLKRNHLRMDTPYNTYTRRGLPPTPICSVGLASLRAALAGSMHSYLYFVARGDGSSHFSETLEEHNRAVNRYQKDPAKRQADN